MKCGLRYWFLLNWENLGLAFIFRVSLKLKKEIIRYSPADGVFFFQSILQNLALLNLSVLLLPFIALLQNTHTTLAEMVKV